jgi:hypothetical protein
MRRGERRCNKREEGGSDPAVLLLDESRVPASAALSSTLERVLDRHLGTVVVVNPTRERLHRADVLLDARTVPATAFAHS